MRLRVLLVNPPIHDFCAYDFWLKPYGLLRVAGMLRGRCELAFFDGLDRSDPRMAKDGRLRSDRWGRGPFRKESLPLPGPLKGVPRRYHRFGLPRALFREFLAAREPFDAVLIQTGMTYWYPGVVEVMEDVRARDPQTRIVLGGAYASLCTTHAKALGAECVVAGGDLRPLWKTLKLEPVKEAPAWWDGYAQLRTGVLKLSDGCPFHCTYCAADRLHGGFAPRSVDVVVSEARSLAERGVRDIAFYDDALLYRAEETLLPFLERAGRAQWPIRFHTPNALHARFVTAELARRMVAGGFKTFYLGLENASAAWQERTGRKLTVEEFRRAVACLREAGATGVSAYVLLGHPHSDPESVAAAMALAHGLRVRVMLADFSPLPGTPDGDACGAHTDLSEPLNHNKTAFPIRLWGKEAIRKLKQLCKDGNRKAEG